MKTIAITGVLGYSGRYIAQEAAKQGWRVIGLTNSAERLDNTEGWELRPMPWSTAEDVLADVNVLVNTYWVRFSYAGGKHAAFSHEEAIRNTRILFDAARRAGVQRIIHTSITCPDATSTLPYFRGKAELETALESTGIAHSILRPAVLFGDSPQESILINNMAWSLRRLPAVATFGWGHYQLQPLHVQDFAEIALREAEQTDQHRIIHATGQETYTFRALWKLLAEAMGISRLILPVPAGIGYAATSVLGHCKNDIMLTRDEISGLCENRLAVPGSGIGSRPLSQWVRQHADTLGRTYESELARRK